MNSLLFSPAAPCSSSGLSFSGETQIEQSGKSRLSGLLERFRFTLNWERTLLWCNVALITSGIAYGFFMRLPAIMVGLAAYGLFYLLMRGKIQQSVPGNLFELRAQLQVKEEENKQLSEKLKANLKGADLAENIRLQVIEDEKQLKDLSRRKERVVARYESEKEKYNRLKKENKVLEDQIARKRRDLGL